jgi:hypothetical protein
VDGRSVWSMRNLMRAREVFSERKDEVYLRNVDNTYLWFVRR